MVGKISWVSLGDHRCLMTSYQIKVIGTLGFTCQDMDTSDVDNLNFKK